MSLPTYLTDAISEAIRAESALRVAQTAQQAATRTLREAVANHGLELARAGEEVEREPLEQLYWQTPGLGAPQIVEAYGLRSTNELSRLVASREVSRTCVECGTERAFHVRNRTELAKLPSRCDACQSLIDTEQARRDAQRAVERDEWSRRQSADHLESIKNYLLEHPDIPEKPVGVDVALVSIRTNSGYAEVPIAELRRVQSLMEAKIDHA